MPNLARLPGPNADLWDWQLDAACRGLPVDVFFPPERERGPARALREARAIEICGGCQVRSACLAHALRVQEPFGVWGGQTEHERAAALRAGRIARPDAGGARPTTARSEAVAG